MEEESQANAIIITPEMIIAGVKAMAGYDPDYGSGFDLVRDIFSAMLEARVRAPIDDPWIVFFNSFYESNGKENSNRAL